MGCRSQTDDFARLDQLLQDRNERQAPDATRRVVVKDPVSKATLEVHELERQSDGHEVPHGTEELYWPGGNIKSVRGYRSGEPAGLWWSWWRTGALRSAYQHESGTETQMTWWHPNGLRSAEGMAIGGRRVGEWRYWYEDGTLESTGVMAGAQRVGKWVFYDERGEWRERGTYVAGQHGDDWELRGGVVGR